MSKRVRPDGGKRSSKKGGWTDPAAQAEGAPSPFAALQGLLGAGAATDDSDSGAEFAGGESAAATPTVADPPRGPARAVVRFERKGHGGKAATRITHLGLNEADLADWCKRMRKALGCGGTTDGADIVLQGDQRDRAPKWLDAQGVRRVTVG